MFILRQALSCHTVEQLKELIDLFPGVARVGRKDELIDRVVAQCQGDGLRQLWERLDELQRAAVAETLHGDGCFHPHRFRAKYGQSVGTAVPSGRYSRKPTLLALLLHSDAGDYRLPDDLLPRLRALVPPPEPVRLVTADSLPQAIDATPVVVRTMEDEATEDLPLMLRLTEQGKLKVSDKTGQPGRAALALLSERLTGGDFYGAQPRKNDREQEVGPIKAFGWPLLLQAGGLARVEGGKLGLSRNGIKALAQTPAEVLKGLWAKWLGTGLIDEFSRIDVIKGQRAKGRVMAAAGPRRAAIHDALRRCPVGAWVAVDELGRYMRAVGLDFDVACDPWKLYICDPNYGSLGHDGFHDWSILQLRYLLAVLFEYAAPLGMIDVAYVPPHEARNDWGGLWGVDEMSFLSRYDGLMYFRLTELGAYCLGLRSEYTPRHAPTALRLSVLPSLRVRVLGGQPSPAQVLLLDTWASRIDAVDWQLDRVKALAAVEKGHDIGALEALLQAGDDQLLPESVEAFLKSVRQQGRALKSVATALLVECPSADIAQRIATHKETARLCLAAGERHLAVRVEHADKFREAVHVLGYGWVV